jgi:hypothetical protein
MVEYQFTNLSAWNYQNVYSFHATEFSPPQINRFYPIPRQNLPLTLDTNIIAVLAESSSAQENWRYGGRLFFRLTTGLQGPSSPNTVIKASKFYLNQIEIIIIPDFASAFIVEIDIPYWHRNMDLHLWEYTGDNRNTEQAKLDTLLAQLAEHRQAIEQS